MEPFGAFRLLMEPHAITQGFVLSEMNRNIIFLNLFMHEKHINTDVSVEHCHYIGLA